MECNKIAKICFFNWKKYRTDICAINYFVIFYNLLFQELVATPKRASGEVFTTGRVGRAPKAPINADVEEMRRLSNNLIDKPTKDYAARHFPLADSSPPSSKAPESDLEDGHSEPEDLSLLMVGTRGSAAKDKGGKKKPSPSQPTVATPGADGNRRPKPKEGTTPKPKEATNPKPKEGNTISHVLRIVLSNAKRLENLEARVESVATVSP